MASTTSPVPTKVIIDTDFGWMNDDCINLLYALRLPQIEVLGVTPLAGNFDLAYATDSALRILELMERTDIPVCPGFDRPLLHERDAYADQVWGQWAKDRPADSLPEGPATTSPDPRHAVDFIGQTILENPGQITLIATGPMTNLAIAIRQYPEIVKAVRQVVAFGGAFPVLPRGAGNITPTAEFNFWVDPEAAHIVVRSQIPLVLLPMNVGRRTKFKESYLERLLAQDTVIARLFRDFISPRFEDPSLEEGKGARLAYSFFSQLVTSYVLRPDLYQVTALYVDVDTTPGLAYGASYGYERGKYASGVTRWPLDTGARPVTVVYDVDFEATAEMVVEALTQADQA